MFTNINAAINHARERHDAAIQKHINGKRWPSHFVVTQFRHRLHVLREDKAKGEVTYSTRQDRFGTVNTEGDA
ncbi:hypothetical protein ACWWJF_00590 [Symbiopectobacterium sp. Eva_TO]